jgi:hypothetical protein
MKNTALSENGRVVAGERHGMCESAFNTAGKQHGMCELAYTNTVEMPFFTTAALVPLVSRFDPQVA